MPTISRPPRADRPGNPPDHPRDHPPDHPRDHAVGRPSGPPTDHGRRLATIRRGPDAELRVVLVAGIDGRPDWVSVRAWARAADGTLWPRPGRYVGLDLAEIPMVVEALRAAADSTGGATGSGEDSGLDGLRSSMRAISAAHGRAGR